jgi:hypothetical protein
MANNSEYASTPYDQRLNSEQSLGNYINSTLFMKWKSNRKLMEDVWHQCIDSFGGEDIGTGKVGENKSDGEDWRSSTCLNIVRNKCMSAFAVIEDQVLQGGRIPYMLKPVRIPAETSIPPDQIAQETMEVKQNYDYMEEQLRLSNSENELIKAFKIGTIYGEAYGEKYVHTFTRNFYPLKDEEEPVKMADKYAKTGSMNVEKRTVKCLAIRARTPWDIFRDMETNDMRKCFGVINRKFIAPYTLLGKKGQKFYLDKYIDTVATSAESVPYQQGRVVARGEDISTITPRRRKTINKLNTLEVLQYNGKAPKTFVETFEKQCKADGMTVANAPVKEGEEGEMIEIMAHVINGYVVKYARTSPEDRPIIRVPFEENTDGLGAIGVAGNIVGIYTSLNSAVRAFEDNKRLAGDVILAIKERLLAGKFTKIRPGMRLQLAEECNDARQAVSQLTIQDVGEGYLPLIAKFEQYADDMSLIPRISQGISTKDAQTAYEISVQTQRAGKYLGAIIKNYDKYWIEPFMTDLYEYNMRDPDAPVPKNPYTVKALGFSSFQDRMVRLQKLQQFFGMVAQAPTLMQMVNVDWLITELAKAFDLDPDQLLIPMEQRNAQKEQQGQISQSQQQMQLQMQQLGVQKMQTDIQATQMKAQAALMKANASENKVNVEAQGKQHEMAMNEHGAMLAEQQQQMQQQQAQQQMQGQSQGNPNMVQP